MEKQFDQDADAGKALADAPLRYTECMPGGACLGESQVAGGAGVYFWQPGRYRKFSGRGVCAVRAYPERRFSVSRSPSSRSSPMEPAPAFRAASPNEEGNYEPTSSRLPEGGGELLMDSAEQQLLKLAHRDADGK
jgi:hypothetical protein